MLERKLEVVQLTEHREHKEKTTIEFESLEMIAIS